jgi:hypothetical protein
MPVQSQLLGPGSLKIGPTGTSQEFAAQLTNVKLTPSYSASDPINVLSGETLAGDDELTWTLSGTILQAYKKTDLIHWAFVNKLLVLDFDFVPVLGTSDYGWKGKVKVVPMEVGGDVKTRNTTDFEFALVGEPTEYTIVIP